MVSLLLLIAGLTLAAPPAAAQITFGSVRVPLSAELEIETSLGSQQVPLSWQPGADGLLTAQLSTPEWEASVSLAPRPGGARALYASVRWLAQAEEARIALVFFWPGAPSAVGRSLRFTKVSCPMRVERGTPLFVSAGELSLAGGRGVFAGAGVPAAVTAGVLDGAAAFAGF